MNDVKIDAALLYCRVSTKKQEIEGTGKLSQEHRCRQYAASLGVPVEEVFGDTKTAGGDFMERPGMVGVLKHLKANRRKRYIVIFDDLKRFSRDTEFHLRLRRALDEYQAIPYCLNFRFDNTAEGRFHEIIVVAGGELERRQLGRQAVQKMTARVEQGYFVTKSPMGYRYQRTKSEGALLVRNEPFASIVKEALEGFASRRFESLAEVQRFLESFPEWPRQKSGKRAGGTNENIVAAMMRHPVYAGFVSAPYWGVSMRQGRHEPLIDVETHERVLARFNGGKRAEIRKDLSKDFPLRGCVNCACGVPLTASWSKGRNARYPYYLCYNRACESYGKAIRRDKIEGDFEGLLKALTPNDQLVRIAADMFARAWEARRQNASARLDGLRAQLKDTERQIETLLDRVVEAKSQLVAHALEERVEKLTKEKAVLTEKIARGAQPIRSFEQSLRTAITFLANPWKLWNSERIEYKRAVLKLAFNTNLQYVRNQGFRTAELSLPFMALADFSGLGKVMVGATGIEPVTPTMST
jgi:site-specific DNA recombinase